MKEIKQNSPHAWLLAARPKTLTGAIIPVMIGTSLAFADGQFKIVPALLCMLFACGMQIAANFINDLFDFLKGTDRTDRLGPGTCLRTRLDYTGSHESGNRCHRHSVLHFRSRIAIHKLGRTASRRMGTHCAGSILRNICLPLYHRPLLSRLGRLTGADILRLCSGRRHILCAGIYIHPKRHHCFAHQRTGNRYLISCEQLSRP